MILGFEVVLAVMAVILSILSFRTLRAIRNLGVGRSFWIPVFVSSVIFFIGSTMTILHELGLSLIVQTVEVGQVSRILALCTLMSGIYSYSRKIKGSLKEEFSIPEQLVTERQSLEPLDGRDSERKALIPKETVQEERGKKSSTKEVTPECKHRLGHLQTLPKSASIPDECLGCDRIIECKHSLVTTLENQVHKA